QRDRRARGRRVVRAGALGLAAETSRRGVRALRGRPEACLVLLHTCETEVYTPAQEFTDPPGVTAPNPPPESLLHATQDGVAMSKAQPEGVSRRTVFQTA